MITAQVTLEYKLRRVITVVSNEPLSDVELQARAVESDLTITGDITDDLFGLRALLRAAECSLVEVNRASDTFTLEDGRAIVTRLKEKKCFAHNGLLLSGNHPHWLNANLLHELVKFGLLRRDPGSFADKLPASFYLIGDEQ